VYSHRTGGFKTLPRTADFVLCNYRLDLDDTIADDSLDFPGRFRIISTDMTDDVAGLDYLTPTGSVLHHQGIEVL